MKTLKQINMELTEELRKARGAEDDPRLCHGGSRFAGQGASPDIVKHIAGGGSVGADGDLIQFADDSSKAFGGRGGGRDGGAAALAEATDTAGGYLVPADVSTDIAAQKNSERDARRGSCGFLERVLPAGDADLDTARFCAAGHVTSTAQSRTFTRLSRSRPLSLTEGLGASRPALRRRFGERRRPGPDAGVTRSRWRLHRLRTSSRRLRRERRRGPPDQSRRSPSRPR